MTIEKDGLSQPTETHYKTFGIVLIVVSVVVGVLVSFAYVDMIYSIADKQESLKISNYNCDQLWNEEKHYWLMDNVPQAEFNTVREKYHQQCISPLFGNAEPDQQMQDDYFLSLSCNDLQSWIKAEKPYDTQAVVDYKAVCAK